MRQSFAVHEPSHRPVLLKEVLEFLDPKPGEFIIDGTLGGGGYAEAIVERLHGSGKFLGFDLDLSAIVSGGRRIEKKEQAGVEMVLVNENFAELLVFLVREGYPKANGLVLDLGLSTDQLKHSGRGFSFEHDEPLLMTYSAHAEPVKDILHRLTEHELAEVIAKFGEERYARRIAKAVKAAGRIETTGALVRAIKNAVPKQYEHGRIHPATRTFMALRIYANRELENLEKALGGIDQILADGGRACVVSFHSLEDRIVKHAFQALGKTGRAAVLTKKPVRPTEEERMANPKARSAKLRAIKLI